MAGCTSNMVSKKRVESSFPASSRIAILPFENLSGKEKAGEKITEYFQAIMTIEDKFIMTEYGSTHNILRQFRIRSSTMLTDAQIDTLSSKLAIDFIFTGSILEFDEYDNNYLGKIPQVSFNCRLIDCKTKKSVWVAVFNNSGDNGELIFGIGAVRSADGLARRMVNIAVDQVSSLFKK